MNYIKSSVRSLWCTNVSISIYAIIVLMVGFIITNFKIDIIHLFIVPLIAAEILITVLKISAAAISYQFFCKHQTQTRKVVPINSDVFSFDKTLSHLDLKVFTWLVFYRPVQEYLYKSLTLTHI